MPGSAATFAAMNGSCAITRHLERLRAARHFLADAAEAGETEHLAADFFAEEDSSCPTCPASSTHRRRAACGQRQQLRHRQLGDADAVGAGRVHHDDAASAGRFDVDVVDAGAGARDRRSFLAAAMMSGVTFVALRTTSASASARSLEVLRGST
jgi:hypothetical protein